MFKKGDFIRRMGALGIVYRVMEIKEYDDLHTENQAILKRLDNGHIVKIPTFFINHSGWEPIDENELILANLLHS